MPAITSVWATDLLERVVLRRDESWLDIACGTGVVARLAAQRGHAGRLVGIDLNTAMLGVARAKSPTIEWIEGSALDQIAWRSVPRECLRDLAGNPIAPLAGSVIPHLRLVVRLSTGAFADCPDVLANGL